MGTLTITTTTTAAMLLLAVVTILAATVAAEAGKQKQWIDRDKVYCGHLDCTRVATYKREKFCSPCDTGHYCECLETAESLPYLRACADSPSACQTADRRGSCARTMDAELCSHIDEAFRYL